MLVTLYINSVYPSTWPYSFVIIIFTIHAMVHTIVHFVYTHTKQGVYVKVWPQLNCNTVFMFKSVYLKRMARATADT